MTSGVYILSVNAGADILGEPVWNQAPEGDLPDLLKCFLAPLLRMSGADAGAVHAMRAPGEPLELIGSIGLPEGAPACVPPRGLERGAGDAIADDPLPDWASQPWACAWLGRRGEGGRTFSRMVAVALQHRGRLLGVCHLFFIDGNAPEPAAMALLKSVGDLLGLALDNAQPDTGSLHATLMRERRAMASEVHDSVAQTLAFVRMRLPLLEESVLGHDDSLTLKYLADVRQAVSQAHTSLREILSGFRTQIDPRGLQHALQAGVALFRERTGIEVGFEYRLSGPRLPVAHETQVFKIVQEALTNVDRHAKARRVRLRVAQSAAQVEVVIEDDGAGMPASRARGFGEDSAHYGMDIMNERARRLGGTLEIGPGECAGTRVRLHFPLEPVAGRDLA